MSRYWYSFVRPTGDPRLAGNYELMKSNFGTPRCLSGNVICAIKVPEGGNFPLSPLSQNMIDYIAVALANGVPEPDRPLGSKIYVYLKQA